jgi:hypothetical protein
MSDIMETPKENKPKSWRKSTTIDGITKSIDVCEIQFKNDKGKLVPAFLVEYCKYGDTDGKYESTTKKICMLENPLSDEDEAKEDESEKIKNDFKDWFTPSMTEL